MDSVITAQAMPYLTQTLGDGAAGITVATIDRSGAGPQVRWDIPRLSRPRVGAGGAPERAHVAELTSRMIALRWQGSQQPREIPAESYLDLHREYPTVFTDTLETPAGWHWMLAAAAESILEAGVPAGSRTCQVKQKFGTLRWYVRGSTPPWMMETIAAAEWLSGAVCEHCGAPGSVRPGGWIRTLCDAHADRKSRR
ncbi:hypothetical protein [Methylobacterium pseudosasicola]|uniref:Uncharacterized protein n=1 Tax=Methylobacterium pseudosasicola TaxID=582667 RepID=A0A1I4PTP8_9HYPH|nr:hypothetical protein [Methylobacterium pseudosasicola]SFM30880.1 hypothetical protein SAMN05192568_102643 [Methylobacterium pseudosasicola]